MTINEFVENYNDTIRENQPLPSYLVQEHIGQVALMFSEYVGYIPNFDIDNYGRIILLGDHETQET